LSEAKIAESRPSYFTVATRVHRLISEMRVFYRDIIYEERETVNQKITQSDQIT